MVRKRKSSSSASSEADTASSSSEELPRSMKRRRKAAEEEEGSSTEPSSSDSTQTQSTSSASTSSSEVPAVRGNKRKAEEDLDETPGPAPTKRKTQPQTKKRKKSEQPTSSRSSASTSSSEVPAVRGNKRKAEEDIDESPGPAPTKRETQPQTKKKRKKSEQPPSSSSRSSASTSSSEVPAVRGNKRKVEEDVDESPGPAPTKRETQPQTKKKRKSEPPSSSSSGPSTNAQNGADSAPQRESPVGARTLRRRRGGRRAPVQQVAPVAPVEDFDPNDAPVLALKGTSQRQFRNKYLKLQKIGSGGFGSVFAGVRRLDSLPVAIKCILKKNILSTTVVGRSGREYQIPSEVEFMLRAGGDHSCIGQNAAVSLIEWFELKTQVIVVMEKPEEAPNLREFLNTHVGPFSEDMAKDMIEEMTRGVVEMLNKGVFHHDLKCENILVQTTSTEPRYRLRFIDFGCSSEVQDIYSFLFTGTIHYAPPEFFAEGWYQAESTCVWQLGALLYEMLDRQTLFSTINCVQGKLHFRRGLSRDCRHFLKSCLKIMPSERLPLHQLLCHPWF